jgi:hypothetical protein
MSRNTKTVLIVLGVVLVLCICSCVGFGVLSPVIGGMFMSQTVATEPADVAAIGSKIVDYETPPGYETEFGMSFFGFDLVGLTSGGDNPQMLIFLMQFPEWANTDQASMEAQLEQSVEQQFDSGELQLETVSEESVTIRDQPVTLTIREGTNADGEAMRQITGIFQGKNGPTILMVMGEMGAWDQAAVDQFLASIR